MRYVHCSLRAQITFVVLFLFGGMAVPALAQPTLAEAEARITDPFFTRTTFSIAKTFYVATNQPGASNSNNGKYPTYQGGLNGPFKDFNSVTLRQALVNATIGLRVYVRAGTYGVPDGGIRIRGGGTEATPIILAGYPGDARPIIDGGECLPWPTVQAIIAGAPYTPRVESLIKLDGRYSIVEDLQLQCGFRYNVYARGSHTITRRNILRGSYEDAIKTAVGGDYGLVADNDVSGFVSQGLDHFGANNWLVTRNTFHHPGLDPNTEGIVGNAITVKGSARNVVITRNTVRDFFTAPDQAAITLGAPFALTYLQYDTLGNVRAAAIDAVAMANTVEDFLGAAFAVQSCERCVVSENTVDRTLGLLKIGIREETRIENEDSGVLPYATGLTARGNRVRFPAVDCGESFYLGQSCYGIFVVNGLETQGMTLDNEYFSETSPFFVFESSVYDLDGFRAVSGAETSSHITPLVLWQ